MDLEIQKFVEAAERYCEVIEQPIAGTHSQWLRAVLSSLAKLYTAALILPVQIDDEGEVEWVDVTIPSTLGQRLQGRDVYWLVFEPYTLEKEQAIQTILRNDLEDIYKDIRNGLTALDAGVNPGAVIWHWRDAFQTHWGHHAVNAMAAIHSMLFGVYGFADSDS